MSDLYNEEIEATRKLNEKNVYLICNEGCHDTTYTEMELTENQFNVLLVFGIMNNENSDYQCKPKISIYLKYEKEQTEYGTVFYNCKDENNLL